MTSTRRTVATASALLAAAAFGGMLSGTARAASWTPAPGASQVTSASAQRGSELTALAGTKASNMDATTQPGKHDCKGKNDCKGQGGCKSADNACKGQNACKGKGGCSTK